MTSDHYQPHPHDHEDCPCMYRQVAVAGELYVPPERERERSAAVVSRLATPAPNALPYTGLHMALGHPSTVIVSDLLSDVFPSYLGTPLLLLGGSTGDYPTITITDADVEEIVDLTLAPDQHPVARSDYAHGLESSADRALG
jgi:hypothetical protein